MKVIFGLVVIAGLVVGLLYIQGFFDAGKVGPGTEVKAPEGAGDVLTVPVREAVVPIHSEAVGTVRSRRTTRVSPRLMATILSVSVSQGDPVTKDDVIALLDDREVKARVAGAEARVSGAEARLTQAEALKTRASADYRRYSELFEKGATTKERLELSTADFESAKAVVLVAEAALAEAKTAVKEAKTFEDYTRILAPMSGVVAERLAEPGDLALPGKPILLIQDPGDLRLEADVRESQITELPLGAEVTVLFGPPLSESFTARIEERAPEADPVTRTFRVKVALDPDSGASAGNLGRIRFRTGERKTLVIPAEALRRIGQLESVRVLSDDRILDRHVRTGKTLAEGLEVLSGLSAGERVLVGR